jgi:CspA family cold shock protein
LVRRIVHRAAYNVVKGNIMATGTVKWFNPTKGYGFIEPEDGGKDAFVHISAVERSGLSTLNEGQKVSYELVSGRDGKMSAENITTAD